MIFEDEFLDFLVFDEICDAMDRRHQKKEVNLVINSIMKHESDWSDFDECFEYEDGEDC